MTIKPATRQGVRPLIGLYSESGCGKTMSALLLARGIAGPYGKIVMIDTESGRGSLYADVIPVGYDVIELHEPFSPERYIEALRCAESASPAVIVVDSATHEWESIGGVTDMAASGAKARAEKWNKEWDGAVQFGDWKHPKMEHAKFMARLLQSACPVILCVRAKYKSRQVKGTPEMVEQGLIEQRQVGKTLVIKDRFTTPIQAEDFIYEMTCHAEILHDHSINLSKCSHPSLRDCFPTTGPITIQHGEKIAAWCASGGKPVAPTASKVEDPKKPLMDRLYKLVSGSLGGRPTWPQVSEQLKAWKILQPTDLLSGLNTNELESVIDRVNIVLKDYEEAKKAV